MHHVPYTHVLHSGKTVIQSHLRLALRRRRTRSQAMSRAVDDARQGSSIERTLSAPCCAQLEYQAGHAIVWRDAVTSWFQRASGIADAKGRVGQLSGPRRGRIDDADRLCARGRDSVGDGLGRSGGRPVRALRVPRRSATTPSCGDARHRGPVLRREHRNGEISSAGGQQGCGGVDRGGPVSHSKAGWQFFHPVCRHRGSAPSWRSHRNEGTPDGEETAALDYWRFRSRDHPGPLRCATRRERARRTPPECRCAARGRHCRRRVCVSVPRVSSPAATR